MEAPPSPVPMLVGLLVILAFQTDPPAWVLSVSPDELSTDSNATVEHVIEEWKGEDLRLKEVGAPTEQRGAMYIL